MSKFARFSSLALALCHYLGAHLSLARLKLDSFTLIFQQVLFDTLLAELLGKLGDFFESFDVLLHLLDVTVLLHLFTLARLVQVLDAAVQEDIFVVGLVDEWANLVDVEANGGQGRAWAKLTLSQILITDILRVLLLKISTLRHLEAIVEAELELPSTLDRLLLLLVELALLSDDCGGAGDLVLCVFLTSVVCKDRGLLKQAELLAVELIKIKFFLNSLHLLDVVDGFT